MRVSAGAVRLDCDELQARSRLFNEVSIVGGVHFVARISSRAKSALRIDIYLMCKNRSKPAPDFGRKRHVISAESGT